MRKTILNLIKLYQKSHFLNNEIFKMLFLSDQVCRFEPSCSNYTYQAVEKYGVLKGLFLGFKRILRCNPLTKGGYDPLH